MAGSFGNYLENAILNHVLGNAALAQPANIYIAFSTADPTDDGSGIAEPAGLDRLQCNDWTVVANAASNTNTVTTPAASGDCGSITHIALFDADTGGNMLAHAELTTPKTIDTGDKAEFAAGEIDITLD